MLDHRPRFSSRDAAQFARDLYALDAAASPLPSERDQNFLLETAGGNRAVLKIANGREDDAMLEAQRRVLEHLSTESPVYPRLIRTSTGAETAEVVAANGERHVVWAVTYLPGRVLAAVHDRPAELLEGLGRAAGELRVSLDRFDHPASHRAFYWDLANARHTVAEERTLITDAEVGAAIDLVTEQFDRYTVPLVSSLQRSVVHGDLNDHNVLVGRSVDSCAPCVSGIVDFGDMVYSYAIADLAIAAAYVVLGSDDPLGAIRSVVDGYERVRKLRDEEYGALFGLIAMRLCMSACIAARQRREVPDNGYLDVSQAAIRRTLPMLGAIPFAYAEARLRGRSATSNRSRAVRTWLERQSATLAPVLDVDLRTEPCLVLDLSVGSPLISGDTGENAEPLLSARIASVLRAAGVSVGVGRYNEPRLLYSTSAFAGGVGTGGETAERRTIHLGIDLFAAAGTPIHAPLDGVVHAFADNRGPLDYGPVIILRHATGEGTDFFSLYGHLSRESLDGMSVGRAVGRGERFAALGTPDVNGGWTPHLHLQIITDLMGLGTDFPGVGAPSLREWWTLVSPDPNLLIDIPQRLFPAPRLPAARMKAARAMWMAPSVRTSYERPLPAVRGWKQYLVDDDGRRYLDAYNNVPHVGHCHPRVVEAGRAQMALLNTNTRYLSDVVIEYAARLASTLPEPLCCCFFLNSASEANELALRLAREHTGHRDMVVLEAAYHGNTNALIDLSPYKHAGPGGHGAPDWVHVAPLPDDYRGPYKRSEPGVGRRYARDVDHMISNLSARGRKLAGFIAETCPSVGGQLMLPSGYLPGVYESVRRAGGVCIADEVQTGLGRMGTHCWAFEAHAVVPDIVVMGKPMGNGHPLAAVVTTREIAASFDNGMEFFSTFGGNTVSCAIGLAVLDVLRDEALQAHALRVGGHMLDALRPFIDQYPLVGDVRGSGLFLGVELVRDRETLEPAAEEASYIVNRMRELGILLGTDGPYHNVLKIRPPMPFDERNADMLVETLGRVIAALS
jgi:4-aminobutyrate aminotransferase-like enzyme/Ser/Thr protein kinase RdoA (MazF antagonist)